MSIELGALKQELVDTRLQRDTYQRMAIYWEKAAIELEKKLQAIEGK